MIGFGFLIAIPVHAQFVTIARKIKSMRTSQADVASVILEAKTFRVYKAVSAVHSANAPKQPTDMAVEAIVTVCHKAGIKCTLDKPSP